jgi:hypothetical protein
MDKEASQQHRVGGDAADGARGEEVKRCHRLAESGGCGARGE